VSFFDAWEGKIAASCKDVQLVKFEMPVMNAFMARRMILTLAHLAAKSDQRELRLQCQQIAFRFEKAIEGATQETVNK